MNDYIIGSRNALNNWLRQFHTFIDVKNNLYKLQESLLGFFKWGDFKPLPKLDYVLIFKSFFAKCEGCSIDDFDGDEYAYYQVSLVYSKNRKLIVHETKNKEIAFNFAQNVAQQLNLKVKDSASLRGKSLSSVAESLKRALLTYNF